MEKLKYFEIRGYGVLVDENAEIKDGSYVICWDTINDVPTNLEVVLMTKLNCTGWETGASNFHKIIFAEKELGLNVPTLPNWREWEVEQTSKESTLHIPAPQNDRELINARNFWIAGYNYSKKLYTEEELKSAITMARSAVTADGFIDMDSWISNGYEGAEPTYSEDEIIQSLRKKPNYIVMKDANIQQIIYE